MKFSMNGFRRQLSRDIETLRDEVQRVLSDDFVDKDDLRIAMNEVITHSNVVNCVYIENDADFNDMSDLEIEHIED